MFPLKNNPIWYRAGRTYRYPTDFVYLLVVLLPAWMMGGLSAMAFAGSVHYLFFAARSLHDGMDLFSRTQQTESLQELRSVGLTSRAFHWTNLLVILKRRAPALLLTPLTALFFEDRLSTTEFLSILWMTLALILLYAVVGFVAAARTGNRARALGLSYTWFSLHFFATLMFFGFTEKLALLFNPVVGSILLLEQSLDQGHIFLLSCALHTFAALAACTAAADLWAQERRPKRRRARVFKRTQDPILFRELQLRDQWLVPVVLLGPVIAGLALEVLPFQAWRNGFGCLALYLVFRACGGISNSLGQELRSKTMDVLLASRLSAKEILSSKLRATTWPLYLGLALNFPLLLWGCKVNEFGWPAAISLTLYLAQLCWLTASFQIWWETRFRSGIGGAMGLMAVSLIPVLFFGFPLHPLMAHMAVLESPATLLLTLPAYFALGSFWLARAGTNLQRR